MRFIRLTIMVFKVSLICLTFIIATFIRIEFLEYDRQLPNIESELNQFENRSKLSVT